MDRKWMPLLFQVAIRAFGFGIGVGIYTGSWKLGLSFAAFEIGTMLSLMCSLLEASHDER